MPVSKKTPAAASLTGRALAQGQKEPSARATKRAAAKAAPAPTQGAAEPRAERGAPQAPDSYSASVWGTTNQFELTVPSGQKCLVHQLSIERLIEMGLLEAINSLSGIVEQEVIPKAGPSATPTVDMTKLLADTSKLTRVLEVVNVIVVEAVDAPALASVPEPGEPRVNGVVYVDSIGLTDRFAIFSEVTGGLDGLAAFRSGSE